MSGDAMEKVLYNVDILLRVYYFLALEDQFRLSRATSQFKEVFETHIWRQRYTTLRVVIRPNYYLVTNGTTLGRVCFNNAQFKEFQLSYAADVEDLTIKMTLVERKRHFFQWYFGNVSAKQRPILSQDQLDLRFYRHVTKLSCHDMRLELKFMNLISECCPNLDQLGLIHVDQCLSDNKFLQSLQRMSKLNSLFIKTSSEHFSMNLYKLKTLLATNNLTQLQIGHSIDIPKRNVDIQEALTLPRRLQCLKVGGTESCDGVIDLLIYLRTFEHLSSLQLEIEVELSDACLAIFAENCKHLEQLTLKYVEFYLPPTFVVPPKLTELTLNSCEGLTCNNLQLILSQFKLIKFCSTHTHYEGSCDFQISPSMLSLSIDGISAHHFKPASESHANLKELAWFQHEPSPDMDTGAALALWANLETLDIRHHNVVFDNIRQLKKLKKVIMPWWPSDRSWPFLIGLIKHPFLEELNLIHPETDGVMDGESADLQDFPAEFKTNLRRLELTLDIFENDAKFWLDLFSYNDKLSELRIGYYTRQSVEYSLKYLACGDRIPKFEETVDIIGITIDCEELRRNFEKDMEYIKFVLREPELFPNNKIYYITLKKIFYDL